MKSAWPFPHPPAACVAWRTAGARFGMPAQAALMVVDPSIQTMLLNVPGETDEIFPVSTSRFGLGEREGSYRTPRGWHEIVARIGDGLPLGAVFVSRLFTGEVLPPSAWQAPDGDRILTRILWLAGREPGRNAQGEVDSHARYIYLHGTNQEQFVGVAASSRGCIRMRNRDIAALFDRIRNYPAWCLILSDTGND